MLISLGLTVLLLFAVVAFRRHHPFDRLGPANQVTLARALGVAALAGFAGTGSTVSAAWMIVGLGTTLALLDGVDGWLARRTRMAASPFGARFDMEVDAALVLVLALLVWEHDKAGPWVLLSGILRYVFVAAGRLWPWLRRPLPLSRRRQAICVLQTAGLLLAMAPFTPASGSGAVAALALAALLWSFARDVGWLIQEAGRVHGEEGSVQETGTERLRRWMTLAAALVLLDVSLTFQNVWPTPAIRWTGALSVELAACLLVLLVASRRFGRPTRSALGWLGAAWVVLVIGRYADVTAPALYGRDVNLYWDLRHMSAVASMLARAAPLWLVAAALAGAVATLALLYVLVRWALARVGEGLVIARERRVIGLAAVAVAVLFVSQQVGADMSGGRLSTPVLGTYARQARLAVIAATANGRERTPAPGPAMDSNLARLEGADVVVLFVESYGASSFDRPEMAASLAAARAALEAAARETGRQIVSAYVESPTFGGSSWLAHLSLLSGIEVRDPDAYALLMTQPRDTMVTAFRRGGYRTVGWMPGLWQSWPEGVFYGFDDIYGGYGLEYRGPEFGWWAIPDQFSIAKLDAQEMSRSERRPVFAFFPTVTTHTPFSPTPPYQADWTRLLSADPYDAPDVERAFAEEPDWMNLGPSYVKSLAYAYRTLAGYLRHRAGRDLVLVVLGDHQPPAAVTGEGARWDVPVHVIGARGEVLDRLRAAGFRSGLAPAPQARGAMHQLSPLLLDAFGK